MKVGIVGLGLMGASFAKTLHAKNVAEVYGTDLNDEVVQKATSSRIVDGRLDLQNACEVDLLVVAVYPRNFRQAVEPFLPKLKSGAIVTDFCGIKRGVMQQMQQFAQTYPQLFFAGSHPMAGAEYVGIEHAVSTLFNKASAILVPCSQNEEKQEFLKDFYLSLGFGEVVVCDADFHDGMIAYTSQLCHVVSNAFIKNSCAEKHSGFSAGSYKDLTRVARLNSRMWAELMTDNRDKLCEELSQLITNLQKYLVALEQGDEEKLFALLEEGNLRKVQIDARRK